MDIFCNFKFRSEQVIYIERKKGFHRHELLSCKFTTNVNLLYFPRVSQYQLMFYQALLITTAYAVCICVCVPSFPNKTTSKSTKCQEVRQPYLLIQIAPKC